VAFNTTVIFTFLIALLDASVTAVLLRRGYERTGYGGQAMLDFYVW
jgi:hypothetical protein